MFATTTNEDEENKMMATLKATEDEEDMKRLKADLREEKYFPEKFQKPKALTLRTAIARHLDGSTNRNLFAEKIYGRYWTSLWGKRLMTDISTEDCRHMQAQLMPTLFSFDRSGCGGR